MTKFRDEYALTMFAALVCNNPEITIQKLDELAALAIQAADLLIKRLEK